MKKINQKAIFMLMVKKIYFYIEKIWFKLPQKLRFLLVGGFNTVVSYILLNVLNILFSHILPNTNKVIVTNLALVLQYAITINMSFITMRYYVFQAHGNFYKEWIKAFSVYIFMYLINAPILSFFISILNWEVWFAQGIYIIFATILIFILHKYYSFRKIN